jgi:hypothetical protein
MSNEPLRPATRRDLILAVYDREAMGEVTVHEIALIQRELIATLGEGGAMSPAEIAHVLLSEDLPVRFQALLSGAPGAAAGHPFDHYEELFAGRATPASLPDAFATIQFLDQQRRRFQDEGDRTGLRYARQTARRARQYAEFGAQHPGKADRKAIFLEIAHWLSIWLQTPDLFFTWLSLRQSTADFQRQFPQARESLASEWTTRDPAETSGPPDPARQEIEERSGAEPLKGRKIPK